MRATLFAVGIEAHQHNLAVELFWPNADSGTDGTHRAIREWLASPDAERLTVRTHRAMGPDDYARMMASCKVLVGNSSSALREGAWIGTPCVNVGNRQQGREHGPNVQNSERDVAMAIGAAMSFQIRRGPHPSSALYGDGTAGEKVADVCLNGWVADPFVSRGGVELKTREFSDEIKKRLGL